MTLSLLLRRTHIYLALLLLPWFLMYGVSSFFFSHPSKWENGQSPWKVRFERPYEIETQEGTDLREVGARILQENGLQGSFGIYRPNADKLYVYWFNFWNATEFIYSAKEKRLLGRDHQFGWDFFLTSMHARGGFGQDSILNDAWGVAVDIVCVGMLIWIATGIYMWWQLRPSRLWGSLALGGGLAVFAVFLWVL